MGDIRSLQDALTAKIERVLPDVLGTLNGSSHLQYYLGNGKDGYVFRMFVPKDPEDRSLDRFVVKIWEPSFRGRAHEVELQRMAAAFPSTRFRTPKVIHVDLSRGCYVMERVNGETAYRSVFRRKRFIDENLFETVRDGFRELNRFGIVHNDAHTMNYMFADPELRETDKGPVIEDAELWIIDLGRALLGGGDQDVRSISKDLSSKILRES